MGYGDALRDEVHSDSITPLIGIFDMYSASLAAGRKVRGMVGSKPLLFNQIAGGLSPRLSLTGLEELGINVAIYSTPCLFAAHTAMANAVTELRTNDGRLAEVTTDDVGVASSIALLERNLSRHHPRRRLDWASEMRAAG